jgi:hypothetical protein
MTVSLTSLTATLTSVLCFEAHVTFRERPAESTTVSYIVTDEKGSRFDGSRGLVFTQAAQPEHMSAAVCSQLRGGDWRAREQGKSQVLVIVGSDTAPVAKVEIRTSTGWTPQVKMVPVLRATVPKANANK